MNNIKDDFDVKELLFAQILGGAFALNAILLLLLLVLQGEVPIALALITVVIGIYHLVFFFIYIYRVITFYQAKNKADYNITYSIIGIVLSPLGLIFSFFNYLIIVLSNIW